MNFYVLVRQSPYGAMSFDIKIVPEITRKTLTLDRGDTVEVAHDGARYMCQIRGIGCSKDLVYLHYYIMDIGQDPLLPFETCLRCGLAEDDSREFELEFNSKFVPVRVYPSRG